MIIKNFNTCMFLTLQKIFVCSIVTAVNPQGAWNIYRNLHEQNNYLALDPVLTDNLNCIYLLLIIITLLTSNYFYYLNLYYSLKELWGNNHMW